MIRNSRKSLIGMIGYGDMVPMNVFSSPSLPAGIQNLNWGMIPFGGGGPSGLNFAPNTPQVTPRVYPLNFFKTVAAGATEVIQASPQLTFKPQRFIVPSTIAPNFVINEIKIGTMPQSVDASGVGTSATVYSEVAQNNLCDFDTAPVGILVTLSVTNISAGSLDFRGTMIGPGLQR